MTTGEQQEVLSYLKRASIIPICKDKKPLISWKEFQTRKPTKEEVEEWFRKFPDMNIGIVTGKISNLAVVDIEKGGSCAGLPDTLIAQTGGGGWHYYYQYTEGIDNRARIRELTDIRGEGGYCFTAGHRIAVRPKNKQYKNTKSVSIENVCVGDIVLSYNEKTGKIENNKVVRIGKREVEKTTIIKFGVRQSVLRCSEEHPIYTTKGWKNAGQLSTSDELLHFNRQQLLFGKAGHKFKKGVQSRVGKNGKDYQKKYVQKIPNHLKRKSKYEEFFETIIEQENLPVTFVGDGSLIIKHNDYLLHPDFVVKGKKKVIEVHIDLHSQRQKSEEKKVLRTTTQEERKKMYEAEGWECLLLNANEWQAFNKNTLNTIENIRKDLVKFVCNGKKIDFVHEIFSKEIVYNIEVENNHNYFVCGINGGKEDWYLVHNCVAPPSLHQSGQKYKWLNKKLPAFFPKHLFGIKEQQDWTEVAKGVSQGQRNETAAKYIGKLMNVFSIDTWENTVWETARIWNEKNIPCLPERELRLIYESIGKRARTNKQEVEQVTADFIPFNKVLTNGINTLLSTKEEDVVSFGYDWLDNQLTGLFPSELLVIGSESGSGKTTFATNIIYKASKKYRCALFALEDRLDDYAIKKLYFEIGKIRKSKGLKNYPWNDYRKNTITNKVLFKEELKEAEENIKTDNILFADVRKQLDIDDLEKMIDDQVANGTSLFLIDHLHYFDLLKGNSTKADYIEQLMVRLKTLQNRNGARIILIVHYKKLDGQKPKLDSFKDSISIVQNANYVINIWRDRNDALSANRYKTTFIIPKSRNPNGEGTIEVEFDPETNDYKNVQDWKFGTPPEYQEPDLINNMDL